MENFSIEAFLFGKSPKIVVILLKELMFLFIFCIKYLAFSCDNVYNSFE